MVASVTACWPLTIDEYFNLEWEYQGALARSKETCSDTGKLCDINKEYNDNNKSGRPQPSDSKAFKDFMGRLKTWSEVDGTRSKAASKMLTPEFIRKHPGLADNRVLKDRMKREEEKNGSEAKGKETSGKRPHGERSKSRTRESSRR
ncbi:hypothetical protein BTUL_0011g00300 [Botrytis tulipae]|uniref:Uncharacterized protein n=1 Tax=Botrytis tulipae TaxID=87230 RepID=A0A4Z1F0Y3_9HELO|nr:hypothetical protein BTUL_0011g00300 [Botrytis tulipae]